MKTAAFNESDVTASICRDEFNFFLREFWDIMVPAPLIHNWHMKYLCDELQEIIERIIKKEKKLYDLIINISPGSTKSTITSVALPAWAWTRDPRFRSINGSHTHSLALDLSRKCRDVIKSEKYQAYFPEIKMRSDQDSKTYFANTKGGMRFSAGVGVSIIGMHAELQNVDDPIDPAAAVSDEKIKSANEWLGTLAQRAGDKASTVMVVTMQRLAQNDPSGFLLEKHGKKIRHICIPAELSEHVNPPELRQQYVNGLMDPVRLSKEVLENARKTLGDVAYAGQYMQHPVPPDGVMFDVRKIKRAIKPKVFKEYVRFWDKASTSGAGDWTVGVLMAKDTNDFFWILDVERFQFDSHARERRIKTVADMDGVGVLIGLEQEPAGSGKDAAETTVRMLAGYRVRKEPSIGDKVLRAETFSIQVNGGNVYIPIGEYDWVTAYLQEMMYFPYSKHDDQIDASSGAFALLARPRTRVGAF